MGVKWLLKELPVGDVKACTRVGFLGLEILRGCLVDIDTCPLVFVCTLRHKEAFNAVNYVPAAGEFQCQIISINLLYKWDYTLVFDGQPPKEKCHEHQRRCERENNVVVDATFIAICVLIYKCYYVRCIVTPAEADK